MGSYSRDTIGLSEEKDRATEDWASEDDGRGSAAESPIEIPLSGWKDVLIRTKDAVRDDNVGILAAGVGFYLMLSLFPFAIAGLSLYGLVADPDDVMKLVQQLEGTVPESVTRLLEEQLGGIADTSGGSLTFGLIASVLFGVWSASKGASALIKATNIASGADETRKFLRLRAMALALTAAFVVVMLFAIVLIAVVPRLFAGTPLGTPVKLLRWPALALISLAGLAALYRFAPDRSEPRLRWITPGSLVATVLWLVGSGLFSVYANNFGGFNETYGSLSAVVVLLLWLNLTAFVILLGAEINAQSEQQTARDTTRGPERPMGERGSRAADTVGARYVGDR